MKINMKNFMNQKIEVTRGDYLALVAVGLIQSTGVIVDLVREHKARTTSIGIAKRAWLVAEDECDLYRKSLRKRYGKKYDLNSNARYLKLRDQATVTFKVYKLMELEEKIAKLGVKETKKREKLEAEKKAVEAY